MSNPLTRLRPSFLARLGHSARALPRPSAGWFAVRLLALGLGTGALLVTVPTDLYGPVPLVFAALVAAIAAALPGTAAVLVVQLLTVGGWLFATWGLGEPVSPLRVLALATILYLHHMVCAYAAVLAVEAAFTPALLARALTRTGVVLAASAALGTGVFVLTTWLSMDSPLAAPLAGLTAAIGIAALLVHLLHRR